MRLEGKRIAILVAHEFEDVEVLFPLLRFSEEGAAVTVATLPADAGQFHPRPYVPDKPITGRFGSTVPLVVLGEGVRWTHASIEELEATEFDAVVVPGGFAPDFLRLDPATLRLIRDMHRAERLVAAICHGPQVLISVDANEGTDLVQGRNVTCYAAVRDDIRNAGGKFDDVAAIVDGNVVTGRCPDDLPEFCRAIIDHLAGTAHDGVYRLETSGTDGG